ncbi:MAG: hypothetical protein ACRC68_04350 [Clostridium sp.]
MNSKDKRFLEWLKINKIELTEYQKQVVDSFTDKRFLEVPRQDGRHRAIEILVQFYKTNS